MMSVGFLFKWGNMNNYHPISDFFAQALTRLPFVQDREHGRNLIRIVLFYMAGQVVFLIVFYELFWFTEFAAVTKQEVVWTWSLWGAFCILFSLVAFIQGASYLDIYRYPYSKMYKHWVVAPSIFILYALAILMAAIVNSAEVDAAHMLLPFIALSAIVQIFSIAIGVLIALTATVFASFFYPDFEPVGVVYICMQQVVLMVMTRSFISERYAKDDLMRRNDELGATQKLLTEASKQNERLRIARNIHDLVGHHVTALSLNLEMLAYKTEGEIQEDVLAVQSIAKELLSKVRMAVTEYRMDVAMPVEEILSELVSHAPSLNVELDLEENLVIRDAAIAEVVLRSAQEMLTNTLKHSNASCLFIQLHTQNGRLFMTTIDDGQGCDTVDMGNGLQGMKERVDALGGTLKLSGQGEGGFKLIIEIPLSGGEL